MKKLLITLISVFALGNIAFAQSTQQKINTLKQEQAKQEQALKLANEKLRANSTEQNYQNVVATRENLEQVTKALEAQKRKAEEEAKKAAEDLYKKKFPEFEFAGIPAELKDYMIEELKKNPNWDIQDVIVGSPYVVEYYEWFSVDIIVKSTSNPQGQKITLYAIKEKEKGLFAGKIRTVVNGWEWHKNPEKFYEAKKERKGKEEVDRRYAPVESMFKHYYYGYTGMHFEGDVKHCNQINLYRLEIPNDRVYYNIDRRSRYNDFWGLHELFYDVKRVEGGGYLIVMCDNSIAYEHPVLRKEIYVQVVQRPESIKEGKTVIDRARPGHLFRVDDVPKDLATRYGVYVVRKDSFPKKLVKTFKIEDYMQSK